MINAYSICILFIIYTNICRIIILKRFVLYVKSIPVCVSRYASIHNKYKKTNRKHTSLTFLVKSNYFSIWPHQTHVINIEHSKKIDVLEFVSKRATKRSVGDVTSLSSRGSIEGWRERGSVVGGRCYHHPPSASCVWQSELTRHTRTHTRINARTRAHTHIHNHRISDDYSSDYYEWDSNEWIWIGPLTGTDLLGLLGFSSPCWTLPTAEVTV